MSTITKLNPMIRNRRGERRGVLRTFGRLQDMRTRAGALACLVVNALNDLTRNPRLTGEEKERVFKRVLDEYRQNMEKPVTEIAAPELPDAEQVHGATDSAGESR